MIRRTLYLSVMALACMGCGSEESNAPPAASAEQPAATAGQAPNAPAAEEPLAAVDPAVANANISMGNMTVDGLTMTNLQCAAPNAGLFGAVTVVAGINAKNAELKECLSPGDRITLRWTQSGTAIETVQASSDNASAARCVMTALQGAPSSTAGECGAVLSEDAP